MKILLISPYHGGSHQAWAEGYVQHSQHEFMLLTLPARFWKWRMHGGAVTLARRFLASTFIPNMILATDMLDLTTFLALTRVRTHDTLVGLYMHENQLTYPLPQDGTSGPMRRQLGERDLHYVFVNYASMMAADFICFNSQYHLTTFLAALPNYLKHFPEYNELGSIATLQQKSQVLPVGIHLSRLETAVSPLPSSPPLILWNQRWEYDKNPDAFFEVLDVIAQEGIPFRLALCGQQFGKRPSRFEKALVQFADQIIHVGYANSNMYKQLLWESTITISTAVHEFFGISILEAIYCYTFPILPNRLSYPELIPPAWHSTCLYENQEMLLARLRWALTHPDALLPTITALKIAIAHYDWVHIAPQYDTLFTRLSKRS